MAKIGNELFDRGSWPFSEARPALEALFSVSTLPVLPGNLHGELRGTFAEQAEWVQRVARSIGLEARITPCNRADAMELVAGLRGTVALFLPRGDDSRIVPALFDGFDRVSVVCRDGSNLTTSRAAFIDQFLLRSTRPSDELIDLFSTVPHGTAALSALMAAGKLDDNRCFVVAFEPDGSQPLAAQFEHAGARRAVLAYVVLAFAQFALTAVALWTLGNALSDGRIDVGRIAAWTALTLTSAAFQYFASRALGTVGLAVSAVVKRRSLEGAFHLPESDIRRKGYGALLATTSEASVVERTGITSVLDVVTGAGYVTLGIVALLQSSALARPLLVAAAAAGAGAVYLMRTYAKDYAHAYSRRLAITDDIVDKIIGHATRAVQEGPENYHATEDSSLAEYIRIARRLDSLLVMTRVVARLWLLVSAVIIVVEFVVSAPPASLGWAAIGVVLVQAGLTTLMGCVETIAEWSAAYRDIRPLLDAGAARDRPMRRALVQHTETLRTVMAISSLSFAYRHGGRIVFSGANLRVNAGDHLLLEGASGSGKTTLFKLLAGEQRPTGGAILIGGTDFQSVSQREWRQRIASAPQFHENYIFSRSLAFNLDPRGREEVSDEAKLICEELGLSELIGRMPQGYAQLVGETGWQLSHGERSRIYIARALLQHADIVLFDESFGALDPDTLLMTIACVQRHARTLVVIAHG